MKKRLFITTGNFSLLNALTLIKMDKEEYEDYLVIFSFNMPDKFIFANQQMASLGNFKKIEWLHDLSKTKFRSLDFDIVYALAGLKINHPNLIWFDEGFGYVYKSFCSPNFPKKTYYWNYLGKCVSENEAINSEPDKRCFLQICQEIAQKDTNKIKIPKDEKTVLIAAQYFLNYLYSPEEKLNFYRKLSAYCIQKGFHVYLKPHPREDIVPYETLKKEFSENFDIFDSYFPLEVYTNNFTLVISTTCTTLFTTPHFFDVPCATAITPHFYNLWKYLKIDGLWLYMFSKEYIPDYKKMLAKITKEMSSDDAKQKMMAILREHLKKKEKTNVNKNIQSCFHSKIVELPYIKKLNNLLARVLSCFCPLKRYRKKIRKIEFFKSTQIVKGK